MMNTEEIIEKLKGLDLSKYPFNEVQVLINEFDSLKVVRLSLKPNTLITRVRRGRGYSKRKDVSYPPREFCKTCQRATLPGQTMFYGTLSDSDTAPLDNRAIALSECSTLTKQGITSRGIEHFTVSNWVVVKDIRVVAIVDDVTFESVSNNELLQSLKKIYCDLKTEPDFDEYARFVAEEFSKVVENEYDYLISAAIADAYVNRVKFDGIAYPSVRMGGQAGMNLALKEDIADERLMLYRTAEMTLYKNGEKSLAVIDRVSDMQSWNYNDTLQNENIDVLAHIGVRDLAELEEIN